MSIAMLISRAIEKHYMTLRRQSRKDVNSPSYNKVVAIDSYRYLDDPKSVSKYSKGRSTPHSVTPRKERGCASEAADRLKRIPTESKTPMDGSVFDFPDDVDDDGEDAPVKDVCFVRYPYPPFSVLPEYMIKDITDGDLPW